MYLFFCLTTWRGLDADWKEGGRSRSEREHAARVDGEMAYLQKEKCGVKAVLFSLHSLDCSVVRKAAFSFLHYALLLFQCLHIFVINFFLNVFIALFHCSVSLFLFQSAPCLFLIAPQLVLFTGVKDKGKRPHFGTTKGSQNCSQGPC